ncbi:hypothetical protein RHGRI_022264 [Rhododendron griersonianum]|uniref:Uncharacterized protein n=1 Tax=Rhododendron griersonianum TaxID=479676 RepID=A0AAV6J3R7_9ERIC|nr:hypothetical protein RHGRI_022264 [Rhododendron griersonianum]
MNDLSKKLLKVTSYVPPINVCYEKHDLHSTEPSQVLLSDPNISQTKGRKKDVKKKDAIIHSGRLKSGHDKRTCPSNPMSKTHKGKWIIIFLVLNVLIYLT